MGSRGLLGSSARLIDPTSRQKSAGVTCVRVELDLAVHRFLRDHLVGSRPLLSTVMGIETIASAVALAESDRSPRPEVAIRTVRDVVVGPPYLLPAHGTDGDKGEVVVTLKTEGSVVHAELTSSSRQPHFTADIDIGMWPDPVAAQHIPESSPLDPTVDADTIYGLFFHGPSFQVVRSARFANGVMIGRLTLDRPPVIDHPADAAADSLLAPLLVELCLQTAGLWQLGALGQMMIPDRIARVARRTPVDADDGIPVSALVTPLRRADGGYDFDAVVVDDTGRVHLEVEGYRTTEFGPPIDPTAKALIEARLADLRIAG